MTRQLTFFKLGIMTVAVALALPFGPAVAFAVLLGAAVGFAANHCFARRVFAHEAREATGLLACLYRAEFTKLLVIGALFAALFAVLPHVNVTALLVGFCAVHLGTSVAALILDPSTKH